MIVVSGGTGTVGREVAATLQAAGVPLRALVRDAARARALLGPDVDLAVADYGDAAGLRAAMRGGRRLLMVAALGPRLAEQEAALMDAAAGAGVRHVVKLSTLGVVEPPVAGERAEPRPYPLHRASERRLERSGLDWTHLRPGPFMQNLLGQAAAIAAEGLLRASWGRGRIAPIDARDVAAVAVRALLDPGHEGRAHALGGPEALSGAEVAERLSPSWGRR
jgi:(4-alkanoyl-5-oxo-2,5-dihydrofuran-3-yl)methyl phosphate reductase